nr:serine/threonine-protein phosphatase 7 long form like [Quercus suber]
MTAANVANYLPFLCSMAAANVARINHADPGPSDTTLLTQQPNHRSEAIWNGQDPGTLTCRSRSSEFSNREPMVDDRVVNIMKAFGLEGLLWIPGREIDHGLITASSVGLSFHCLKPSDCGQIQPPQPSHLFLGNEKKEQSNFEEVVEEI